ncbi:MAG: DUF4041 domain-containing protein [Pseudomonadota bacterium]
MTQKTLKFNPPPGWPKPPDNWEPPKGWTPDPSWPAPPDGWEMWVDDNAPKGRGSKEVSTPTPEDTPERGTIEQPSADTSVRLRFLESENQALRAQLAEAGESDEDLASLNDEVVLQQVGIYRYHHPLENAEAYKTKLKELNSKISAMVKSRTAIEVSSMFTFDNSLAQGKKMTRDFSKLMLIAYNSQVDACIRALRAGNVLAAKKRVERTRDAIARLGSMMEMRVSNEFHGLRLQEIELTADFQMKKQEEREAAKEERARLREEKRVQAELAAERERLDKERTHLVQALEALSRSGQSDSVLESKLAEIDQAIEQNDYRQANVRAGYVYVISNLGAFGKNVVKIGLTRRLEPIDRVNELGGASVPFKFDVHALFFSEDAVTLEKELHDHFSDRRLNHANARKEFFFAKPSEVRDVLLSMVGNLLEFCEEVESTEFFQSRGYWPEIPSDR